MPTHSTFLSWVAGKLDWVTMGCCHSQELELSPKIMYKLRDGCRSIILVKYQSSPRRFGSCSDIAGISNREWVASVDKKVPSTLLWGCFLMYFNSNKLNAIYRALHCTEAQFVDSMVTFSHIAKVLGSHPKRKLALSKLLFYLASERNILLDAKISLVLNILVQKCAGYIATAGVMLNRLLVEEAPACTLLDATITNFEVMHEDHVKSDH